MIPFRLPEENTWWVSGTIHSDFHWAALHILIFHISYSSTRSERLLSFICMWRIPITSQQQQRPNLDLCRHINCNSGKNHEKIRLDWYTLHVNWRISVVSTSKANEGKYFPVLTRKIRGQKKCDLLVIVSTEWTYLIDSSSDSADTDKKRRGRDNKSVEKSEEIISGWRLFVLFVSFSSRFHSLFNAED